MKVHQLLAVLAIVAVAPFGASADGFSGTWRIENVFNGASAIITCTLEQADNELSGTCRPEIPGIEPSKLTGTVDGASAKVGLRRRVQR